MRSAQWRFIVVFTVLVVVFWAVLTITPVDTHVVLPLTNVLARASAVCLSLVGVDAEARGTQIVSPSGGVDVRGGCNGLEVVVLVVAAILAFKATMRERLMGALVAALLLEAINVIRITTLYLLSRSSQRLFEIFHLAVWQTVMFGLAIFIFVYWTRTVRPDAPAV